jgi:uncharacterized protein (UPF0335 family)
MTGDQMDTERWTRPPTAEGTADRIRDLVRRIRALDDKQREVNTALRDVYAEARGYGINARALKLIARDPEAGSEAEAVQAYLIALGATSDVLGRLKRETAEEILFGSTGFPSDSVSDDMVSFDIERERPPREHFGGNARGGPESATRG